MLSTTIAVFFLAMSLPIITHDDEPQIVQNQEQALVSMRVDSFRSISRHRHKMDASTIREPNIHSIRALDKQIEEGRGDMVKLRRTRNSLLNISTCVPPEILGEIFVWSLAREAGTSLHSQHFEGLRRGSYNFLLVCHHWFEVDPAPRKFGASGGTPCRIGRNATTVQGSVPSTWCWTEVSVTLTSSSMVLSEMQSEVRSYKALYDRFTSIPTMVTP